MNRRNHSGVFLMEMIAVVFFFMLCASVCVQAFVKADRMSRQAVMLNQGVLMAQSTAEIWKADGILGLKEQFQAEEQGENLYSISFCEDGTPGQGEEAVYTVTVSLENDKTGADFTVTHGTEVVYTLHSERHETGN